MDNVREDPKEKNIDLIRIGEATRKEESCKSLIVSTLMEERKYVFYCANHLQKFCQAFT